MVNALVRPVTVMSAVVLQGEGGSIANGIAGGGRGIYAYCSDCWGKGVVYFILGKLPVIFLIIIIIIVDLKLG